MNTVTAHTLAYDLEAIIAHYGDRLPTAVVDHVRSDLNRWEAQQVDAETGRLIFKQWLQDRAFFTHAAAQLDDATLCQMARDYVAFLRLWGATELNPERMVNNWKREISRLGLAQGGDTDTVNHDASIIG